MCVSVALTIKQKTQSLTNFHILLNLSDLIMSVNQINWRKQWILEFSNFSKKGFQNYSDQLCTQSWVKSKNENRGKSFSCLLLSVTWARICL